MDRKKEIYTRLLELVNEQSALRKEFKEIEDREKEAQYGFGPGDIIVNSKGEKFLVTGFDYAWALGRKIRNNGEPSRKVQGIYGPSTCKKVAPETT